MRKIGSGVREMHLGKYGGPDRWGEKRWRNGSSVRDETCDPFTDSVESGREVLVRLSNPWAAKGDECQRSEPSHQTRLVEKEARSVARVQAAERAADEAERLERRLACGGGAHFGGQALAALCDTVARPTHVAARRQDQQLAGAAVEVLERGLQRVQARRVAVEPVLQDDEVRGTRRLRHTSAQPHSEAHTLRVVAASMDCDDCGPLCTQRLAVYLSRNKSKNEQSFGRTKKKNVLVFLSHEAKIARRRVN